MISETVFWLLRAGAVRKIDVARRSHSAVSARPFWKSRVADQSSFAFASAGLPYQFDRSHFRLRWLPKTGSEGSLKTSFEASATASSVVFEPVAMLIARPGSVRQVFSAALTNAEVASSM